MVDSFREGTPGERAPERPEVPRPAVPADRPDDRAGDWFESRRAAYEDVKAAVRDEYAKALAGQTYDGGDRRGDDLVTRPTGEWGGAPDGRPRRIGPNEDTDVRRSLERENSGAVILAEQGYRVKQNPSPVEIAQARQDTGDTGRPRSNPDYLLEGRVFDCYSPTETTGVRNIWSHVAAKIEDGQTQRVVVNLDGWQGNLSDLRRQFNDWPIENLKEVKAITPDGDVVQVIPDQRDTESVTYGD